MNSKLEVIVIGAGHAGLSASYFLKEYGIPHLVFERGKIGESWRSKRWDSFVLNSTNWCNQLAGMNTVNNDPDSFSSKNQFIASLEEYVSKHQLPVVEHAEIISVTKHPGTTYFTLMVLENGHISRYFANQVIVCSGSQNERYLPAFAKNISSEFMQLHASEYRNPAALPQGAVLVVGSGQSGCQLADELVDHGRTVFLSTSKVGRLPRYYRGKDMMHWLIQTGFFETSLEELADPARVHMKAPQLTGTGGGRKTISLQSLAKKGVVILGRTDNTDGNFIFLRNDAAAHVQFADGFSKNMKEIVDFYISCNHLDAPQTGIDPDDQPDESASCVADITALHLRDNNITSIIWATGFKGNLDYIKLPVLDNAGRPEHHHGKTAAEGLYFLGLPWQRKFKSGLIHGAAEDAAFICEKVYDFSRRSSHQIAAADF